MDAVAHASGSIRSWSPAQGHADHFLRRLGRVSNPESELAMRLYYDTELLRFVLAGAHLPEGAGRAAISLDHPHAGPFVIVTRGGRFVTCLGRNMRPRHPVVPRDVLDQRMAALFAHRGRVAEAKHAAAPHGGIRRLVGRLIEGGESLSREEFVALRAIAPLYAGELVAAAEELGVDVNAVRATLATPRRLPRDLVRPLLRLYDQATWASAHIAALIAAWTRSLPHDAPIATSATAALRVSDGVTPIAARWLWSGAAFGCDTLEPMDAALANARSPGDALDAMLRVSMVGLRHPHLRARARGLLATANEPLRGRASPRSALLLARMQRELDGVLEAPERARRAHREIGARRALEVARTFPPGTAFHFPAACDVPEAFALAVAASYPTSVLSRADLPTPLCTLLPWLVETEAEQLYLPMDFTKHGRFARRPEAVLDALEQRREFDRVAPVPQTEPARKRPCPCGSGRKYKRCCGVTAVERCA